MQNRDYFLPGLCALWLGVTALPVQAEPRAPRDYQNDRPTFFGTDFVRRLFGEDRLYFRAGALYLSPDLKTHSIELKNLSNVAEVAVEPGPQNGSAYSDPLLQPGAIIGYHLPWGDGSWAVETVAALPPTLNLKIRGEIANKPLAEEANGIPTGVPPLGSKVGTTKALPPIVTLVKRFRMDHHLRPYAGLGFTYLYTYDSKVENAVLTEFGRPDLDIEDKFGYVLQAGLEYRIYRYWWANLDVKYVSVPDVRATMEGTFIRAPGLPQYQFIEVGDAEFVADLNNILVQVGIGFTF
ncbi:outer membrane protein W [Alcanivorax sp. S71-1-4]|uniref:OmpW/AlkL family protein n=1 Tax=Alcanivorax sp. S71-1-4 TaxID=1177159 RepID=UPI00135AC331|nr:OmpW family outer membrane protein [Alcanivorax sp. S71-1-4]KAF0810504.1 outer membrane protein W [Alcanivorax sp. S71-1-4]